MRSQPRGGFTLIELLTVIAIISILFGLVAVAAPRVLERTKIAATEADFKQIQTALATYQTTHGTLPPAYGYLRVPAAQIPNNVADWSQVAFLEPYTSRINIFQVFDQYDHRWSETYDTDGSGQLEYFEFEPEPQEVSAGRFAFDFTRFYGVAGYANPVTPTGYYANVRPFIYVPVNKEQARRVQNYFEADPARIYAETWNWSDPWLASLQFPPPYYDDYVLISVGPGGSTGGVATPPAPAFQNSNALRQRDEQYAIYHIEALRVFYLATRDLNRNGQPDFDFRSRSQGQDGSPGAYNIDGAHLLPAQRAGNLQRPYGPMIFRGQG